MRNSIKIAFLLLLFHAGIRAQTPGYMGKRLTAGYGFYTHPAVSKLIFNYSDKWFNTQHEFFLEYVVRKRCQLGLSFKLYRYTYNNYETLKQRDLYYQSNIDLQSERPSGSYDIKARNYSFYARFFRRKYLAPWGSYFLLGASMINYTTHYDPARMDVLAIDRSYRNAGRSMYLNNFGPEEQRHFTVDIFFGIGNSRIFFNHLVLDYGCSLGLISNTATLLRSFGSVWNFELDGKYSMEEYISGTAAERIGALNRANFYLRLGYLF